MQNLVAIKVKIVLGPDGHHQYPPFNQLPPTVREHMDWAQFIDKAGTGWVYDALSGFNESDEHNDLVPNGHEHENRDPDCWFGCIAVPRIFAEAAAGKWPDLVTIVPEVSFASFWEDRVHIHDETEILDKDRLQALAARMALEADPNAPTVEPSAEILELRRKMLDPEDPRPGIRRNHMKTWTGFKKASGLTFDPEHA